MLSLEGGRFAGSLRNFRRPPFSRPIRCQERIIELEYHQSATTKTPLKDNTRDHEVVSVDYLEDEKGELRKVGIIQTDGVEIALVDDETDEDLTDEQIEHVARLLDKTKRNRPP